MNPIIGTHTFPEVETKWPIVDFAQYSFVIKSSLKIVLMYVNNVSRRFHPNKNLMQTNIFFSDFMCSFPILSLH